MGKKGKKRSKHADLVSRLKRNANIRNGAAATIQATFRGYLVRDTFSHVLYLQYYDAWWYRHSNLSLPQERKETWKRIWAEHDCDLPWEDLEDYYRREDYFVTKIQAFARGFILRQRLKNHLELLSTVDWSTAQSMGAIDHALLTRPMQYDSDFDDDSDYDYYEEDESYESDADYGDSDDECAEDSGSVPDAPHCNDPNDQSIAQQHHPNEKPKECDAPSVKHSEHPVEDKEQAVVSSHLEGQYDDAESVDESNSISLQSKDRSNHEDIPKEPQNEQSNTANYGVHDHEDKAICSVEMGGTSVVSPRCVSEASHEDGIDTDAKQNDNAAPENIVQSERTASLNSLPPSVSSDSISIGAEVQDGVNETNGFNDDSKEEYAIGASLYDGPCNSDVTLEYDEDAVENFAKKLESEIFSLEALVEDKGEQGFDGNLSESYDDDDDDDGLGTEITKLTAQCKCLSMIMHDPLLKIR